MDKKNQKNTNKGKDSLQNGFSSTLTKYIDDNEKKISNPFQGLTDKMIISTSKDDKKIHLWDERTGGIVYSYEDENIKTFISKGKLSVLGVYSEYIICLQENKSMFMIWKTDAVDTFIKCSPIDENITCFKSSSDNLYLFIGTESGRVFIYELFSGNLLANFQPHLDRINDFEINYNSSLVVTTSRDNSIKSYLIESIVENNQNNLSPLYENIVGNKDIKSLKFVGIPTYLILGLSNDNSIICFSYPELKILNKIYFNEDVLSIELNNAFNSVFVQMNRKIYYLKLDELFTNKDTQQALKQENLQKIIQIENNITKIGVGSKYLLLGYENGSIGMFDINTFAFSHNITNHKGHITNILCVNRPICQYGLNFNQNLSTLVIKPLKKPNLAYSNSISIPGFASNTEFHEKKNELSLKIQQERHSNLNEEYEIPKEDIKVEKNILDPDFLQKKLTECYLLLNSNK